MDIVNSLRPCPDPPPCSGFNTVIWLAIVLIKVGLLNLSVSLPGAAASLPSHIKSKDELNYNLVLFDYFQQHYFNALVEHEYATAQLNPLAIDPIGQVLKGGMMLSYGMPEESQALFNRLLNETVEPSVSNRAWYYLAKIYYAKSEFTHAKQSMEKIRDNIPADIYFDYFYLSTLIGNQQASKESALEQKLADYLPGYPYLLFNMAISHLRSGDTKTAIEYLTKVASYSQQGDELSALADRARNGLAQLSLQEGQLLEAWNHLAGIRTTGLYSNRALLAYAWSAIKMEQYNDAIPALNLLNSRSIAIPEVQETKVLIAHLYEKQGNEQKALEANIAAEQEYQLGMQQVAEAREIINGLDVPREFINNIDSIMAKSDWYASNPSVDYQKLTPFLIDLMASHAFNEVLKELADLYFIRDNIEYWLDRTKEHRIILSNAKNRNLDDQLKQFFKKSTELGKQFSGQKVDLELYILALDVKDQERMNALLDNTRKELDLLNSKIDNLSNVESAYKQPKHYQALVEDNHRRLMRQLNKTKTYIAALEPIMRRMVNLELDKHQQRMHYYWAQSRLAKVRLYDKQLLLLEKTPNSRNNIKKTEGGVKPK